MTAELPYPPAYLRGRVGPIREGVAEEDFFRQVGADARAAVTARLPEEWTWPGKVVLDFGCGSGRTLRHFADVADVAEFWGSEIHAPSVEWLAANLSPPFSFVLNDAVPPIALPPAKYDLIYALSVFTHLSTHWAGWLIEMHRLLKPGGLLLATVMSERMSDVIAGEPWDEQHVGMNVYEEGQGWDFGGPMVLHSPWWIEAHWGKLFEIEQIAPFFSAAMPKRNPSDRQDLVIARKTDRIASHADLVALDPTEPREATALYHDVLHLRAEVAQLRARAV